MPEIPLPSTIFPNGKERLPLSTEMRDQMDWTPEFSRRARGFATYAALRQLGRAGVADLVERCCWAAREIVAGIGRLEGAEVLAEPVINQAWCDFWIRLATTTVARTR